MSAPQGLELLGCDLQILILLQTRSNIGTVGHFGGILSSCFDRWSWAKTYVFAETAIRDREVGGSNPLALTIYFKLLRTAPAVRFQLLLWEFVAVLFID